MKLKDVKEKMNKNLVDVDEQMFEETEINPAEYVEEYFFNKPGCGDYRNESIDFLVENKIHFISTSNNIYDMMRRFVKIECPLCGKSMEVKGGGGNSDSVSTDFTCECGMSIALSTPINSIYFNFKSVK